MKMVLVVDDAASIRNLLAKCLELNGFCVETAEDGKMALEMILRKPYDLVFLDIRLPIISGTEVLKRMREKGVQVPAVIITAFGNIKNAIDCTRLGAVAYVQKPFTANRIVSLLDELKIVSGPEEKQYMRDVESLLENERFEEVQKILKNYLATNPLEAEVYHMLAETSVKLKRPEEASQYRKLYEAIRKK